MEEDLVVFFEEDRVVLGRLGDGEDPRFNFNFLFGVTSLVSSGIPRSFVVLELVGVLAAIGNSVVGWPTLSRFGDV